MEPPPDSSGGVFLCVSVRYLIKSDAKCPKSDAECLFLFRFCLKSDANARIT